MFVTGAFLGAAAVISAQGNFGCFRRQEDVKLIDDLQGKLQQVITAAESREASLQAEIEQLKSTLSETKLRLAERVQRVTEEAILPMPASIASGPPPPPPPPLPKGKLNKRARELSVDSKQLLREFTSFLEDPANRNRALLVKNSLRLDVATLIQSVERAACIALSSHVEKWLKEEKRPESANPAEWETAVDESLSDQRNEALDRYKFPNASLLVREVLLHLRHHYRPKAAEAQGNIIAELQNGNKRLRATSRRKSNI